MISNWLYMSSSDSLDHPGSILYHSEFSQVVYSTNQYLVKNFFFAISYIKLALKESDWESKSTFKSMKSFFPRNYAMLTLLELCKFIRIICFANEPNVSTQLNLLAVLIRYFFDSTSTVWQKFIYIWLLKINSRYHTFNSNVPTDSVISASCSSKQKTPP